MARIGILGGSFNPPHIGHVACARAAIAELGLDRVWLMPVAEPPHKRAEQDPGAQHRLALCRLAAAEEEEEGLEASSLEVDRGGPSYTVDTLQALRDERPQDDLTFVAGGDVAMSLPRWREPERVLGLATFAVADRAGAEREEILRRVAGLRSSDRVQFFDMPQIDVSSSLVRERVAAGDSIAELVPAGVARYIDEHRLYRSAAVPAP